jgi:hypothetical protein
VRCASLKALRPQPNIVPIKVPTASLHTTIVPIKVPTASLHTTIVVLSVMDGYETRLAKLVVFEDEKTVLVQVRILDSE